MLQMWTNEIDYVIAESLAQAQELTARHYLGDGYWQEWLESEMTWRILSPTEDFQYWNDDWSISTVKTVSEWIDIYAKACYFACGEL